MNSMVRYTVVRMRRQGWRVWAIAEHLKLSEEEVIQALRWAGFDPPQLYRAVEKKPKAL